MKSVHSIVGVCQELPLKVALLCKCQAGQFLMMSIKVKRGEAKAVSLDIRSFCRSELSLFTSFCKDRGQLVPAPSLISTFWLWL